MRDDDRRRESLAAVPVEESAEVDVEELVAVQSEDVSLLPPRRGGEAKPSAAPERFQLGDRHDLRT